MSRRVWVKFIKKFVKALLPPIVPYLITKLRVTFEKKEGGLFNGDDELFKRVIGDVKVYAEYGCGASTIWVAKNTMCEICSVDSSSEWIRKVENECGSRNRLTLHLADLGPVSAWGRPESYEKAQNFNDYTDWIWTNTRKPDLVLIDGRFRVCCFLTCLLKGKSGTKIIFDDYTNRPHYHLVEKYIKPIEICGRQALFLIPDKRTVDINNVILSIGQFRFVLD